MDALRPAVFYYRLWLVCTYFGSIPELYPGNPGAMRLKLKCECDCVDGQDTLGQGVDWWGQLTCIAGLMYDFCGEGTVRLNRVL